jgi:hypothetical protein
MRLHSILHPNSSELRLEIEIKRRQEAREASEENESVKED